MENEERDTSADREDNLAECLVMRRYAAVLGWRLMVHKCVWRRSRAQGAYSYVAHPCLYDALRDKGRESVSCCFQKLLELMSLNFGIFDKASAPSPTAFVITIPSFLEFYA